MSFWLPKCLSLITYSQYALLSQNVLVAVAMPGFAMNDLRFGACAINHS